MFMGQYCAMIAKFAQSVRLICNLTSHMLIIVLTHDKDLAI